MLSLCGLVLVLAHFNDQVCPQCDTTTLSNLD